MEGLHQCSASRPHSKARLGLKSTGDKPPPHALPWLPHLQHSKSLPAYRWDMGVTLPAQVGLDQEAGTRQHQCAHSSWAGQGASRGGFSTGQESVWGLLPARVT